MDSESLLQALRIIRRQCKNLKYIHVIAFDEQHLVNFNRPNTVVIMNTRERSHPGEHWLLFITIRKRGRLLIYFFDSFGELITFYNITLVLPIVYINTNKLQCLSSSVCGQFLVFIVYNFYCKLFTFKRILMLFKPKRCNYNDNLVKQFYNNLLLQF